MNLKILYKNNSSKDASDLLVAVKKWYSIYGVDLEFITENKNDAPHIYLEIKDNDVNSGGAGALNSYGYDNQAGGRRDKDNGWYPMVWKIKEIDANMLRVAIHEIMHCLHFQFDLGDIHSLPDGGNMGNGTVDGNANAMKYFLDNAKRLNKPDKVIVHHTSVSQIQNSQQYKATLDYHINQNWQDIGYHYFIEPDGTIKRGRWEEKEGAHTNTTDYQNRKSIGVCLTGNFDIELPTKEQEQALKGLLEKLNYKDIRPHRAFENKTCYGSKLSDDWAENLINSTMMKLIKKTGDKSVYCVSTDGKRNEIINVETFNKGKEMGLWGDWADVQEVADLSQWPEGNAIILVQSN